MNSEPAAWLQIDAPIRFRCRPEVGCAGSCCCRGNVLLSPYDVIRLKRRLKLSSGEFLRDFTGVALHPGMKAPMLALQPDEVGVCRFLVDGRCRVWSDRPHACRLYPLDLLLAAGGSPERRFHLMHDPLCQGHGGVEPLSIREWLDDPDLEPYDQWASEIKDLMMHEGLGALQDEKAPMKAEMWFTALYDLDRFRDFVFGSSLLSRFDVDGDLIGEIRYDDEGLLRFALQWVRFSILGERTMRVRPSAVEAFQARKGEEGR